MSLRKATGIIIGCVVTGTLVVGLLGCLGALVLLPDYPKHAHRYLSQVQVDPAYRQVGQGGQGNCNCNLEYDYIGPSHTDPAQVFSGPMLALQPTDGSDIIWDRLLKGEGTSEASGNCRVVVYRYQRDRAPREDWKLSIDERARGVRPSSGSFTVRIVRPRR